MYSEVTRPSLFTHYGTNCTSTNYYQIKVRVKIKIKWRSRGEKTHSNKFRGVGGEEGEEVSLKPNVRQNNYVCIQVINFLSSGMKTRNGRVIGKECVCLCVCKCTSVYGVYVCACVCVCVTLSKSESALTINFPSSNAALQQRTAC